MSTQFKGELVLKYLDEPVEGKWFRTVRPFSYKYLEVPGGTYTDFASVPRGFLWMIDSVGKYGKAAVLHDWLCEKKIVPRKQADKIFLDAMKELGVPWWKRRVMYSGVRAYSIATFKK